MMRSELNRIRVRSECKGNTRGKKARGAPFFRRQIVVRLRPTNFFSRPPPSGHLEQVIHLDVSLIFISF